MPDSQRTHYVGDDCPGGHRDDIEAMRAAFAEPKPTYADTEAAANLLIQLFDEGSEAATKEYKAAELVARAIAKARAEGDARGDSLEGMLHRVTDKLLETEDALAAERQKRERAEAVLREIALPCHDYDCDERPAMARAYFEGVKE